MQQDLADALGADKSTVQGRETGRQPLTSVRTGTAVLLRFRLLDLGADPQLIGSFDTAAEADYLLDRLLDDETDRHPFASRVLPQPLSDLLAWPLNPRPPRVVAAAQRPPRRGPVSTGPMLTADNRKRLLTNLCGAAENPTAPPDRVSQVRRQVAYLASFDRAPDTARWLAELRAKMARTAAGSPFSPGWAEARSGRRVVPYFRRSPTLTIIRPCRCQGAWEPLVADAAPRLPDTAEVAATSQDPDVLHTRRRRRT